MRGQVFPVAITIAGSDSGGGAGIEADLKTFAAMGVHGAAAITSVTAQNTYSVSAIHDLPSEMVVKQIEAVAEDMGIDAGKTGMLSNKGIIEAVARSVGRLGFPLVVDPVMIAKSGAPLLKPDAVEALVKLLIPEAILVTPNKPEAERLAGINISSLEDARRAARIIVEDLGASAAIVKGGHLEGGEAVDVLYYEGRYKEYRAPRIRGGCTHGTGCSFSAAIAAGLARGMDLWDAVDTAKRLISMAIDYGVRVGRGFCPVNPSAWLEIPAQRYIVLEDVRRAVAMLVEHGEAVSRYVPEVQVNIAMAIDPRYARGISDVAGVKGRIIRYGGTIRPAGPVEFGASSHMARLVLAAMRRDPSVRAAMNLAMSMDLVEAARSLGYKAVFVDRALEPDNVKNVEGKSMEWVVEEAFSKAGGTPDIIYDHGDYAREPMIRILGRSASEVAGKALRIIMHAKGSKDH